MAQATAPCGPGAPLWKCAREPARTSGKLSPTPSAGARTAPPSPMGTPMRSGGRARVPTLLKPEDRVDSSRRRTEDTKTALPPSPERAESKPYKCIPRLALGGAGAKVDQAARQTALEKRTPRQRGEGAAAGEAQPPGPKRQQRISIGGLQRRAAREIEVGGGVVGSVAVRPSRMTPELAARLERQRLRVEDPVEVVAPESGVAKEGFRAMLRRLFCLGKRK
mmetsp:Transcript_25871/g.73609  ORF Transcript_25871/g.73609 Transcript_25871/m.73609 type:complete len:222 (-) Transcript_25871:178-843(-)